MRRELLPGRAAPTGLPGPRRHRHQRQPPRPRARRRSTSTTSRAGWAERRACGAMSRVAWAWSRSSSATSRGTWERRRRQRFPVARIIPGQGVELEGGERIEARHVISNADPRATLKLLGESSRPGVEIARRVDSSGRLHGEAECRHSRTAQFQGSPGNVDGSPPGSDQHAALQGRLDGVRSRAAPRQARSTPGSGPSSISRRSTTRRSPPEGVQTMSVFAQYVPHTFARGHWDSRRDEVKEVALRSIGRFCDNFPDSSSDVQVLGPPDIEKDVGLTGGHIFQGECLPPYMWDKSAGAPNADARRLPLRGVYPSRRQRDRHQRPQRRHGGAGEAARVTTYADDHWPFVHGTGVATQRAGGASPLSRSPDGSSGTGCTSGPRRDRWGRSPRAGRSPGP